MTLKAEVPDFRPDVMAETIDLRRSIHYSTLFRYVFGASAIIVAFVLKGQSLLPWPQFLIVTLVFLAAAATLHLLSHHGTSRIRAYRLQPYFDVGFAPFFFAVSGGYCSPISIVLLIAAMYNGLLFTNNKRLPDRLFLYPTASYLVVALLQKSGIFPWYDDGIGYGNGLFFFSTTAFVTLIFLTGYFMVRRVNARQIRILEEHTRSFALFLERYEEEERRCSHARKMEAIGRITRGITHDFNNNIAAISGYATMLKKKLDGNEQSQSYLRHILEASKHASEILERLSCNGKGDIIHPVPVDITETITTAVAKAIGGSDVNITISPSHPPAPLLSPGNSVKFQAVLASLLRNACDACIPPACTVTVASEIIILDNNDPLRHCFRLTNESYIRITVTDNGRGMTPEVLDRIFEPFFTTKPKGNSSGMELANVWSYVIDFKGAIDVRSRPGEGSTFHLYLPLIMSCDHVTHVDTSPATSYTQAVLIVDDEPAVREIYSNILQDNDYTVFTSNNGAEAMKLLDSGLQTIGLVMLDMMMPVMDGSATFCALRAKYPSIKVLFMSGYVDQEKITALLKEPGTAFFRKPCDDEHLLSLVQSMLSPSTA